MSSIIKSVLETRVLSPSRERVPHFAGVVPRLSEMCRRADGACLPLPGETLPVIFSSRKTLKKNNHWGFVLSEEDICSKKHSKEIICYIKSLSELLR